MKLLISLYTLLLTILVSNFPYQLQSPFTDSNIQVVVDETTMNLPEGIQFHLVAESSIPIKQATLLYGTSKKSCQDGAGRHEFQLTPTNHVDLKWEWEFRLSGTLPPGAELWWQWEITDQDDHIQTTERQTVIVHDQRYSWRKLVSGKITVQWYEGSGKFGQSLLEIASDSVMRMSKTMNAAQPEAMWINVYPSSEALREVLVQSQEWAGAVAFSEYNNIILGIHPDELSLAHEYLPHEITHLMINSLVFNCRGIRMPTWLEEGLAVISVGPITAEKYRMITRSLSQDSLPRLSSLSRGFSAYSEEASVSYAQSGMVVEYMLEKYGNEKMGLLLSELQSGLKIDEALKEVYGIDTDALDAEWRDYMGYKIEITPSPAADITATKTQIPTLALWTHPAKTIPTDTQTPKPTSTELASVSPTYTPATSPEATSLTGSDKQLSKIPAWVLISIALFLVFALLFFVLRRKLS